jgi:hypothetical protein
MSSIFYMVTIVYCTALAACLRKLGSIGTTFREVAGLVATMKFDVVQFDGSV